MQRARLLRVMAFRQSLAGKVIFVRYESLCLNPETTLCTLERAISETAGVSLELPENPLDAGWDSAREGRPTQTDLDSKPPSGRSIGSWRHHLSSEVLRRVDAVRDDLARHCGFDWYYSDGLNAGATQDVWTLKP